MADGLHTPGHVRCITCWAREQAVPPEGQLRILVREDWLAETAAFVPRVMTREQGVAAELLTMALDRFVDAYGVDVAAPRIASVPKIVSSAFDFSASPSPPNWDFNWPATSVSDFIDPSAFTKFSP